VGNWEIYTMDLTSGRQIRQTYHPANDTNPAWSHGCGTLEPNCITGTIAFQSDRTGNWDIFLLPVGADGEPIQVTTDPGNDTNPFWAADQSALAFQSDRAGNWDIFTIRPDGSDEIQRTDNPADEIDPAWAPNNLAISYVSNRSGDWDVYLLDPRGGQERQLTSGPGNDLLPSWSPDGYWIAFQSDRDGNWEIYAYNAVLGTLVRLTDNPADDQSPTWNCAGTRVIFHTNRDGNVDLYSVALDDPSDVIPLADREGGEPPLPWWPPVEHSHRVPDETWIATSPPPIQETKTPTALPTARATVPPTPTPPLPTTVETAWPSWSTAIAVSLLVVAALVGIWYAYTHRIPKDTYDD